jgi:FtsZ-binding cell division protein ZapB
MLDKREVDPEEVNSLCEKRGIIHMEVSAKSGENVQQAFESISAELMRIYPKEEQNNEPMAVVEDIRKKRKEFQLQAGQKKTTAKKKCC